MVDRVDGIVVRLERLEREVQELTKLHDDTTCELYSRMDKVERDMNIQLKGALETASVLDMLVKANNRRWKVLSELNINPITIVMPYFFYRLVNWMFGV